MRAFGSFRAPRFTPTSRIASITNKKATHSVSHSVIWVCRINRQKAFISRFLNPVKYMSTMFINTIIGYTFFKIREFF